MYLSELIQPKTALKTRFLTKSLKIKARYKSPNVTA